MDDTLRKAILKANSSVWQKNKAPKLAKKGLRDLWFTIFNDVENQLAYWIRYTIMVPKATVQVREGQNLDQAIDGIQGGVAHLWFAYESAKNPSENFMIKKAFPLSKVEGTKELGGGNVSIVKIGDAEITLEGMKGGFETAGGKKVAWDLTFSHFEEPYCPIPAIAKILKITTTVLNVGHPNMRISGKLTVGGKTTDIHELPGEQSHSIGAKFDQEFTWVHCQTIKGLPDAWFNFASRESKAMASLFDGTAKYFLNKISTMKSFKVERSANSIKFSGGDKSGEMSGELSIPLENMVCLEYVGPENSKIYCFNTLVGNLILKLTLKSPDGGVNDVREYSADRSCAFETNWLKLPQETKYLPFDKEAL